MTERGSPPHPIVTDAQMHAEHIVRFDALKRRGIPLMFIDSVLPGHQRMNYAVVGDTASENPEFSPAITTPHKFQIGMGFAAPGNGPAYHTHDYVELFLVLKGKWRFYWGYDPDPARASGEAILRKWDIITLPPGIYRGFEVAGKKVGWFFAVLDPHTVFANKDPIWSPHIETLAAQAGFQADAHGKMVQPPDYTAIRDALRTRLEALEPQVFHPTTRTRQR